MTSGDEGEEDGPTATGSPPHPIPRWLAGSGTTDNSPIPVGLAASAASGTPEDFHGQTGMSRPCGPEGDGHREIADGLDRLVIGALLGPR